MTQDADIPSSGATYRQRILAEIEDLRALQVLSKSDRATVDLDQQSIGRVSRIDSLQVQAMAQAAEGRRVQRIRQLEAALQRLEADEFGYCIDCGDAIAPKRLEIDLTVLRCIACAS